MTRYTTSLLLSLTLLVVGCSKTQEEHETPQAPPSTDYNHSVGWLHGNCLAILNPELSAGTRITVIQPGQPQTVSTATIAGHASSGQECKALLEDRRKVNIDSGYTFYSVSANPEINLGIAMLGQIKKIDDFVFDYCNTHEGISFTLKTALGKGAPVLWDAYYYLGYESDATCDDQPSSAH